MSNSILGVRCIPQSAYRAKQAGISAVSFRELVAQAGRGTADVLGMGGRLEVSKGAEAPDVDAYMEHLKKKYGQVTIESIGRDQESLERAGKRMRGRDIVIAPNILEDMASDPKTAAYYEQKIDYFFTDVIPNGKAFAASIGLTFEPCGVVVHEDGTVTYICGGGDSPERVAEVNKINMEKAKKKAEQRRRYQEQAAAAAPQRRDMWEHTAERLALKKTFSNIGDLLKMRMASAPAIIPEVSLPAGASMFILDL